MKSIKNPKVTVSADGKSGSMTFDIVDQQYTPFLIQRVTVGHLNPLNLRHPRHVQISEEAVFVKAFGNGFAFPLDDIVAVATAIEPKTSFAPVFQKNTNPLVAQVASELNPDFQWEVCGNSPAPNNANYPDNKWIKIEGATSSSLDPSKVKSGQWVHCIASSEAGSVTSNPVQVK